MKHFDIAQWTDFVRGLGASCERAIMQQHLSQCESCAQLNDMLRRLLLVASSDSAPEVPEDVMRNARAIFSLRNPEKITVASLIARLVYDSFREPLPAGVRSQRNMARVALYEAGEFCIDLRLEYQRSDARVGLVGQIVDRKNPELRVAGVPLSIQSGHKVLAQTSTNQYGEFQMEYRPTACLSLHIQLDENCIEVPWADVVNEHPV